MKNLYLYIETLENLKNGKNSVAAKGFNTALYAWLSAPKNFDREKILCHALLTTAPNTINQLYSSNILLCYLSNFCYQNIIAKKNAS